MSSTFKHDYVFHLHAPRPRPRIVHDSNTMKKMKNIAKQDSIRKLCVVVVVVVVVVVDVAAVQGASTIGDVAQ